MKNVLIPTKLDKVAKDILVKEGFTVTQDADTEILSLVKQHPETEIVIVRSEKMTPEIMDLLPELKVIVRAGAGYNTIDIKYARKKGIDVMNTPGANSNGVAEEVFAMALAAYRHLIPADASTRAGGWEKKKFMGREITGKTLGIIGLGNIGQLVAKHASGFDMTLLAYDPIIPAAKAEELGVKLDTIEAVFAAADIITLHIPENDETRGMINKKLFDVMKPGAMLINCARAGIINEDDLRAAKAEKNLLFCNDVYPADAAGPKSVADIADVMLPHLGANTHEANFNAAKRAAEQIVAYDRQGVNTYVVNKAIPDGLDESYQRLAFYLTTVARNYLGTRAAISNIHCSFYGDLCKYAKWFYSPICAALSEHFEFQQDPQEAQAFLADKGIAIELRPTDESKRYGNAMTIDLESNNGSASIRGTVTENHLLISRINDYDQLYFVPSGNIAVIEYEDRPGVLSVITGACANANINIEDIHAPLDPTAKRALTFLRTDKMLPAEALEAIRKQINATTAFSVVL